MPDSQFENVPFRMYGRDWDGADCVGIVFLYLKHALGSSIPVPQQRLDCPLAESELLGLMDRPRRSEGGEGNRGDIIFFREKKSGKIKHVAIALGGGRILHSTKFASRIDDSTKLIERMGYTPVGTIPYTDEARLRRAIECCELGEVATWVAVISLVVSVALSVAAYALSPKPKVGRMRAQKGAYSYDAQFTQISSELPLPDILGQVHIAGNAIYTTLQDKTEEVEFESGVRMNRIVVFASAPSEGIDYQNFNIRVNGLHYDNPWWKTENISGDVLQGFQINPPQTKQECVTGDVVAMGHTYNNFPTMTLYNGEHATSVPIDIRAHYDRNFPVYGLSGCTYIVARFVGANRMGSMNISATVKGRKCRTFDADGFVTTTETGESHTGVSAQTRYKLDFDDIIEGSVSVEVDGTPFTEISASNQTGDVFYVNRLKGYIEFPDNLPGAGDAIEVDYTHYTREWTQNPASQLVYLLTDQRCGKGFPESKIDWAAAVELREYCDEEVMWGTGVEMTLSPRFTCNYSIDSRASLQEHIRAVVDSFYGWLFISQGRMVMRARKAESSVFTFDESKIIKKSFLGELIDRTERANRVRVFFRTADVYNTETELAREDENDQRDRASRIGNGGVVEETLHLPQLETVGQAERYGEVMVRENLRVNRICQFKTDIKGLALEPGDVVTVTHSSDPTWTAKLARVENIDHDEEDRLVLRCSEYVESVYI